MPDTNEQMHQLNEPMAQILAITPHLDKPMTKMRHTMELMKTILHLRLKTMRLR